MTLKIQPSQILEPFYQSSEHMPLTLEDVWSAERFQQERPHIMAHILELKRLRRMEVGPSANVLFENKTLIWWQIQEMVRIEKGGSAQALEELEAYNPLIPSAGELVFTLLLEFPDTAQRIQNLLKLGDIEKKVVLRGEGNFQCWTEPIESAQHPAPLPKASAVNFLRFVLTSQGEDLPKTPPVLCIEHPQYTHKAPLSEALWSKLVQEMQTA